MVLRYRLARSVSFVPSQLTSRRFVGASQNVETSQPEEAVAHQKTEKELEVEDKLRNAFEDAEVEVVDTSGNCGRSFAISISSSVFEGKSPVNRHRLVAKALKGDIEQWHAVQFKTVAK